VGKNCSEAEDELAREGEKVGRKSAGIASTEEENRRLTSCGELRFCGHSRIQETPEEFSAYAFAIEKT
jgi:hypothetical protein